MNRAEALTIAREHVIALSAPGATFTAKCAAVESFARFLIEDADTDVISVQLMDQERPEPLAAWERELLDDGPKIGDRYRDCDGDVWTYQADGRLHLRTDSTGTEFAEVEKDFPPLVKLHPDD